MMEVFVNGLGIGSIDGKNTLKFYRCIKRPFYIGRFATPGLAMIHAAINGTNRKLLEERILSHWANRIKNIFPVKCTHKGY
jgi:hypothetical protein